MLDRLFMTTLTFCLLVGGTLVVGAEMLVTPSGLSASASVSTLPRVVVAGKKLQPNMDVVSAQGAASGESVGKSVQ